MGYTGHGDGGGSQIPFDSADRSRSRGPNTDSFLSPKQQMSIINPNPPIHHEVEMHRYHPSHNPLHDNATSSMDHPIEQTHPTSPRTRATSVGSPLHVQLDTPQQPLFADQLFDRLPISHCPPTAEWEPDSITSTLFNPARSTATSDAICADAEVERSFLPIRPRLEELVDRFFEYYLSAYPIFHEPSLRALIEKVKSRDTVLTHLEVFIVFSMTVPLCRPGSFADIWWNIVILAISCASLARRQSSKDTRLRHAENGEMILARIDTMV